MTMVLLLYTTQVPPTKDTAPLNAICYYKRTPAKNTEQK